MRKRTLAAQIQTLFDAFFTIAPPGTDRAARVQVSYVYPLGPVPVPQPQVPITLVPFAPVDREFVAELAATIHHWCEDAAPPTSGRFRFALKTSQPGFEANDVSLPLADISNL